MGEKDLGWPLFKARFPKLKNPENKKMGKAGTLYLLFIRQIQCLWFPGSI